MISGCNFNTTVLIILHCLKYIIKINEKYRMSTCDNLDRQYFEGVGAKSFMLFC